MLISYLVITLIPFVFFSAYVVNVANESYAESLVQKSLLEIERAEAVLDVRLTEMLSMAYQLAENTILFSNDLQTYDRYENIRQLRQMCAGNQFVTNIALWHTNRSEVYTSYGMMTQQTYADIVLQGQIGSTELNEKLDNCALPFFISLPTEYLVYAAPCRLTRSNDILALFLLRASDVFGMLANPSLDKTKYVLLVNNAGQVIHHTLPDTVNVQNAMQEQTVQIDGVNFRKLSTDGSKRLQLHMLLSQNSMVIPLNQISATLALTIVLLIGCVGLSTWLAFEHFKPVRHLGQLMTGANKPYNNWEELHRDVYDTICRNEEYVETILDQRRMLREHNLLRLLYGELSGEKLVAKAAELGLNVNSFCCAVCIRIGQTPRNADWLHAMQTMDQRRTERETLLEMERENLIALIMLSDTPIDEEQTAKRCQTLLGDVRLSEQVSIGVGSVEKGLEGLRSSYLRAMAAMEFVANSAEGEERMLGFSEMLLKQEPAPDPKEQTIYINLALKQGDEKLAMDNLGQLVRWVWNASKPQMHYVCYSLVDILIPMFAEACGEEKAETLQENLTAEIHSGRLERFQSIAEAVVKEICAQRNKQTEHQRDEMKVEVLAYVHERFADSAMSLEYLAERFGFSNFFWSRYFKDVIGQNFNDYVWILRLERAKQLLATSMPIAEVVESVGYIDVRSFTRRFKNSTGVTPAQYKKEQSAKLSQE